MQLSCPCCHAHIPLEAALQDEAGRELVGALARMEPALALPVVHYLGFFRPAKQQLGWGRALRLMRETLELQPDAAVLTAALLEANRSLDEKRAAGAWKPLGNHQYLRRVLESASARQGPKAPVRDDVGGAAVPAGPRAPQSRTGAALQALEGMRRAEHAGHAEAMAPWLHNRVLDGFAYLYALGLEGTPAAEVVEQSVSTWLRTIASQPLAWDEELDSTRLRVAFETVAASARRWPAPALVLGAMGPRPKRAEAQRLAASPPPEVLAQLGRRRADGEPPEQMPVEDSTA
jgi:hypothetical protein